MRVPDTSAWIEWYLGSEIGVRLREVMPDMNETIVPTIVQLELAKWLRREVALVEYEKMIAYTTQCLVAELDTPIALLAAELSREHKLSTADSVIYASAQRFDAQLLTCDSHFKGLENVVLFEKKGKLQ
jgi:predicted nucleic acid-binding protein